MVVDAFQLKRMHTLALTLPVPTRVCPYTLPGSNARHIIWNCALLRADVLSASNWSISFIFVYRKRSSASSSRCTKAAFVMSGSISCITSPSGRLRLSLFAPLVCISSFHSFSRCRLSASRCLMSFRMRLIGSLMQFFPAPVPAISTFISVASCSTLSM